MAKGEHKKVDRPVQSGYDISLDPQGYNVKDVRIRFGTVAGKDEDGKDTYKWDLTVGPIEFKSERKKAVIKVDDDQLPTSARSCYYQILCEVEDETLITEARLLTAST